MPQFGAGFPRAYRLLLTLSELGHEILFLPAAKDAREAPLNREALEQFGIRVIREPRQADVAILSRPHNAYRYMPKVYGKMPVIYDTEALWYRRYDLQMKITGRLPGWATRIDEIGLCRLSSIAWVVNRDEAAILLANGVSDVRLVPHCLEPIREGKPFSEREGFLFVGGKMEEDSSNEDALYWLQSQAWKELHSNTGARLSVAGKVETERIQGFNGVDLLGLVPKLEPLYQEKRVFLASTRFATGIPWKVHEAMANGIPCVISPLLAEQLGADNGVHCLVADTPVEWQELPAKLHQDEKLWNRIREGGFSLIERDCKPEDFKATIAESLSDLLEQKKSFNLQAFGNFRS